MAAVAILAMAIAMAMFVEVQWQLAEIAAVVLSNPKWVSTKRGDESQVVASWG
jgi:hypothetical protein